MAKNRDLVALTQTVREEAWLGDAVLSLFVRDWLLARKQASRSTAEMQALFELFVSNQFLSAFGEPTMIEAEIGRFYRENDLGQTFDYIQAKFVDRFIKTARKRGLQVD